MKNTKTSKDETAHLLRSKKNAKRLLDALGNAKAGKGTPQSVRALRREMNLAGR